MDEFNFWASADPVADVWGEPDWLGGQAACLNVLEREVGFAAGGAYLDVGCGPGRLLHPLAEQYPDSSFFGLDVSLKMIRSAPEPPPNLHYLWWPAGRGLPFEVPPLDGAWAVLVFQHLPDDVCAEYVAAVAGRLKPDSRFVFQFVPGNHARPLDYARWLDVALAWCHPGFVSADVEAGLLHDEWAWITARKAA